MKASTMRQKTLLQISITKKIVVILFFLSGVFAIQALAQNINGFRIQISADTVVNLVFNAKVTTWKFDEGNGFDIYNISLLEDNKMSIIAKNASAEILHLNIEEGKRKHKFTLLYKEGIERLVINHDYSDLNKLEKFIKTGIEEAPDAKLIALTAEADNAFKNAQYEQAYEIYKQVLAKDSSYEYAKKQMAETEKKIIENKAIIEKQREDKFNETIMRANSAFNSGNYDDAIKEFTAALNIKPNDEYSQKKLQISKQKIEDKKIAEANWKKDSAYRSYMTEADKALDGKLFDDAMNACREALNIKPNDPTAWALINEIEKQIARKKQLEENDKLEALYKSYIATADKAFFEKSYEEAKSAYTQALSAKQNDKYAAGQIKKIEDELARIAKQKEQEQRNKVQEEQYTAIINLADSAYNMQAWDVAKEEYTKASQISSKPYPQERIKDINKKLIELRNKEVTEKQKQQKDSLDNAKYMSLMEQADNYFEKQDYDNAKAKYKQALTIRDNQFAKDKLLEIENILSEISKRNQAIKDSLAKENEINKKYNALIAKARVAYTGSDYVNARAAYQEAMELKPNEEEPAAKLAEIDNKLADMVKAKEMQDKYDSLSEKAGLALGTHDYATALELYKEALEAKPDEAYFVQKQITFLERQLAIKDSTELEVKKAEDRRKKFNDGMNAYNKGRTALKETRYEDALAEFQTFLTLIPDTSELNTYQYNQQELINFAKAKVKDLRDYLERQKQKDSTKSINNSPIQKIPTGVDSTNRKSSGSILGENLSTTTFYNMKLNDVNIDYRYFQMTIRLSPTARKTKRRPC